MVFNNIYELIQYYREYGKQSGFRVMKRSSEKGNDGELRYVTLACARSRTCKSNSSNTLKPHPSINNNCNAQISVGLRLSGSWRVNSTKLDHNHDLSPTKSHIWKCYWEITTYIMRKLEIDDKAGIRLNKSYNLVVFLHRNYMRIPHF